jgi:lambda repressor-like predicted transcriptional regulator
MYEAADTITADIVNDLRQKYGRSVISKKELSKELNIAISTLNNYMAKGYGIPRYRKIGEAKNAKVVFPIIEVAKFLSDTVEVHKW